MHKPKFLGWRVLSSLNGCQECHRITSQGGLLWRGQGRGDGHRVVTLRECLGGFLCPSSYIHICSGKPCLRVEELGSGSSWFPCVGWASSALACSWQNAGGLVSSWSLHTNQPQRLDWVFWRLQLQVQQLFWRREKPLVFISAGVWNVLFLIQMPWCGTCHVYRTTACCLLRYLGQCWNQLW